MIKSKILNKVYKESLVCVLIKEKAEYHYNNIPMKHPYLFLLENLFLLFIHF